MLVTSSKMQCNVDLTEHAECFWYFCDLFMTLESIEDSLYKLMERGNYHIHVYHSFIQHKSPNIVHNTYVAYFG